MLFVVHKIDKRDSGALRSANRPAHLAYLKSIAGVLRLAGPFLAEDGESMIGSLWIIEAEGRASAEALAAADPYAKAGLFESVTVTPWRRAMGVPLD
jgi:hypothetical protein